MYFQDKQFFDIEIKDMVEAADKRESDMGMGGLGDLLKSLGMGGGAGSGGGEGSEDFLMKMLSSLNDE